MKKILTFDCYGTLLDTSALSEKLEEIARQNGLPTERAKALFGTYEDRAMYGESFQPYQQALTNMLSYVDMELNTTVFSASSAQLFQLHRHFAPPLRMSCQRLER